MNIRPPLREVPDESNWTQGWTAFFTQLFEAVGWVKGWSFRFTIAFGNVAANSQSAASNQTITGVRQGDSVQVTPYTETTGITYKGLVTADDIVSVYAVNFTTGLVNVPSMQYRIVVIQN